MEKTSLKPENPFPPTIGEEPSVVSLVNSITVAGISGTSLNAERQKIEMKRYRGSVLVTSGKMKIEIPDSNIRWIQY